MAAIFITLGRGVEFGIDEHQRFVMRQIAYGEVESLIDMGPATDKQLADHLKHMGQIGLHAAKEE